MERQKILFVDDERLTCKYFKLKFSKLFDVVTAETLEEASLHVIKHRFEAIICDYNLNNPNDSRTGLNYLNELNQKICEQTKLFLCSTYNIKDIKLSDGIFYISKPINKELLIDMLMKRKSELKILNIGKY